MSPRPEVEAPPPTAVLQPTQPDVQSLFGSAVSGGDGPGGQQPQQPLQQRQPHEVRPELASPGELNDGVARSGGHPPERSPLPEATPPVLPDLDPLPPPTLLGPVPPTGVRVQELEGQMLEMQLEMQIMQGEMENLAKVAGMANDEAQRTALRMDVLEYEWLLWNDGHPQEAPNL